MNIVRTEQEIWDLLNQCADAEETGGSKYPGMSYEQGIKAAIEWIIGDINDHPINDYRKELIMGFTTPCFIRKSTYKLRKKLDELGYRLFGEELNEDLCIFTSPECGLYNIEFFSNIPHPEETDSIDCGDNEELFLSIASLRDDTNENQWFTNGEEWAYHPKTECCSPCNTVYRTLAFDSIPKDTNMGNYHKATVGELIEHFKGKEVNHG